MTVDDLYHEAIGKLAVAGQADPPLNLVEIWLLFDAASRAKTVVQDQRIRMMIMDSSLPKDSDNAPS